MAYLCFSQLEDLHLKCPFNKFTVTHSNPDELHQPDARRRVLRNLMQRAQTSLQTAFSPHPQTEIITT